MNVVEKANEVSVFGRWAANVSQVTSPWEYSIRRNVPAFTQMQTDDATKIWSSGSTLSWTIPRLGLLKDMRFRIELDLSAAGNLTTRAADSGVSDPLYDLGASADGIGASAFADTAAARNRLQSLYMHPGGLFKLFQQFEIKARTREVARMYPENIYYHYMSQVYSYDKSFTHSNNVAGTGQADVSDESQRISKINILNGLHFQRLYSLMARTGDGADAITKKIVLYMQVPFSYFQRMGNAFLTSFCEDLSFNMICAPSAAAEALGPIGSYLAAGRISVTPQYSWIQPRPEEMAKLRQQMLASSLGIPRLQFSCLSEGDGVSPAQIGSVQDVSIKLNCSYPVIRTLFWIQSDVGLSQLRIPHAANTVTLPINQVTVSGSGTTFLTLDETALLEQMVVPPHSKVMGDRLIYAINWSLLDSNTEMGGYLPTRNLSNLTLSVRAYFPQKIGDQGQQSAGLTTFAAATNRDAANYRLRVIHEYYVIEQTVPSNGQVNVSAFD
jgi:hypothetical protein